MKVFYDGSNYLIENTTISYTNSATLLQHLKSKKYETKNALAFAPNFLGKYVPLKSSQKEVENILSYFKGKVFNGSNANLNSFNNESPSCGILHLATHAIMDDENPDESHLVFSAKDGIDSLRTRDIYVKDINASLVVLSACQTDIGLLKKGEGMISLSRAFFLCWSFKFRKFKMANK